MPTNADKAKSATKINILRRNLLGWFQKHRRDLPWRRTSDPYAIVVSEVMLQQTQVDRVIPKYQAFLKALPTWKRLAATPQAEVVKLWHGLGYNRRALGLHKLAKAVVERGGLPEDPVEMQELPGIGPYTSQAVAAFAFRRPKAAPVDTNIERVLKRVFNAYKKDRKEIAQLAREVVPKDVWSWSHAMMDHGATICTAQRPKCEECPLKNICAAYPCLGNDIQKTKQSKFADSDRFYRGKLLSLLRQSNVLRRNNLGSLLHLNDQKRLDRIIDSLKKDQFIIEGANGKICLKD